MSSVSIPSSVGTSTVLTVTGDRTLAYATLLQNYLDGAIASGTLNLGLGQPNGSQGVSFAQPIAGKVNEAVVSSNEDAGVGIGATATIGGGYQAVFDNVNGLTTVIGSGHSLDAIFAGVGAAATFLDNGGDNTIIFVNGNNVYVGDTLSSATFDTIVGGSGFDTVNTGSGRADFLAGTGDALVTFNDTVANASSSLTDNFNSLAFLGDGAATVNAYGIKDAVIAVAPGQVINAGLLATDVTGILIAPGASSVGDDVINANAATVAAFDMTNGNTIFGGTGTLLFIGGANVEATIVGGSGVSTVFGASADSITWTTLADSGSSEFVAGGGNETLQGSGASGSLILFASSSSDASISGQISDSLVGGMGNDTLVSGAGHETLSGGGGSNVFLIDATNDGVGAKITITDFAPSSNVVAFANYTTAQIDAALAGATTVIGAHGETDTMLALSDNTTVTFIGISSLTGHTIGG